VVFIRPPSSHEKDHELDEVSDPYWFIKRSMRRSMMSMIRRMRRGRKMRRVRRMRMRRRRKMRVRRSVCPLLPPHAATVGGCREAEVRVGQGGRGGGAHL